MAAPMTSTGESDTDVNVDEEKSVYIQALYSVGVTAATYPLTYAKVLVQIGHEPIAPHRTRTIFGRDGLALPNVFKYVGHIRRVDGYFGLYRGITYKIASNFVGNVAVNHVMQKMKASSVWSRNKLGSELDGDKDAEDNSFQDFLKETAMQSTAQGIAVIVSHPFHVMAIRSMAQFVGCEDAYSGWFSAIGEIFDRDGILGFFAGLAPRLIGELLTLWIANTITHILNNFIIEDVEAKQYTGAVVNLLAGTLTYPFSVVSAVMVVTHSGLAAGSPPNMLHFRNWIHCWRHLSRENALKRGSSMLFRYYTPPVIMAVEEPIGSKVATDSLLVTPTPLPPPPPLEHQWKYN
ncbi:PREDICTED: mitochondrial carrier homolog 2-like [Priapulus caudatus]|uniref:Mitochondrial carrier homolog 2-like n=1 Tax=Priapulus caudatus TaxID=37621 RepID=A0ABM1EM55_PRICU|nr:PREDICTED: mitochondrial carrier homolog 2-like [Priapulus caudatus]